MSNASQATSNLQSRADDLWTKFERLSNSGTLNLILQEANAVTFARDLGREADTSELEYLLGTVEDLVKTVTAAVLGALVLAEEAWDGIENAPQAYFSAYQDLRALKGEVERERKHARALCSGVKFS